jgi:hypothetical protein
VSIKRLTGWTRRGTVAAVGVVAALAVAAPIAEAGAATSHFSLPALPALPTFHPLPPLPALPPYALPAFTPAPLSFVGPSIGSIGVAIGPTVIGSVFNGGTTVCVSTVASNCSTNASP